MRKFEKIDSWDQLNQFVQDLYNNLSLSDLRPSEVRTEAPTTDTLDKGRFALYDDGTTRRIYFRALDGTITSTTLS